MADSLHLDTHAVVWIGAKEYDRFPKAVVERINDSQLMISPTVILELQYLAERKKVPGSPFKIIEGLQATIGLEICPDSFEWVVKASLNLHWTRDPFDRLIVAQASLSKAPLLTKDREILRHYSHAVWD